MVHSLDRPDRVAGRLIWLVHRRTAGTGRTTPGARILTLPVLFRVVGLVVANAASRANEFSDLDGDGFGVVGSVPDLSAFHGWVFPCALAVPGNCVAENGVEGDLPAGTPPYVEPPVAAAPWKHRPDIVLVVLENFRADLLGGHHARHRITPVVDALGAARCALAPDPPDRGESANRDAGTGWATRPLRCHRRRDARACRRDSADEATAWNAGGKYSSTSEPSTGRVRLGSSATVARDVRIIAAAAFRSAECGSVVPPRNSRVPPLGT
jgi:hypothetical protein